MYVRFPQYLIPAAELYYPGWFSYDELNDATPTDLEKKRELKKKTLNLSSKSELQRQQVKNIKAGKSVLENTRYNIEHSHL